MDIKKFLEIEEKYNLCYWEIDGINLWEYSRFEIWNYVFCTEKLSLQKAHRTRNIEACSVFFDFITSFLRFKLAKKRNVDVCFITHERRVKEKDYYDCIYSENLIKKYPNSIVIERPHNYSHLKPVRTNNLYYTDWIIVIGNLFAKLNAVLNTAKYKKIKNLVRQGIEEAYLEMKQIYQLETSLESLVKLNTEKYFMCKIQYRMYQGLLNKFSPKVIVEVCHYSRQCMLINEIAKKMNIPTIELQHGTMHSEHAAYQYSSDKSIQQLPDEILLFSDYWSEQIHMPIKKEKLYATGFPYFENKIEEYRKSTKRSDCRTILFISQGTIGKELSLLAVKLSNMLQNSAYRIIYKLHPGEYSDWKQQYNWLVESNIEVVDNLNRDIYSYFAESDIQIGVYSTAIYEGLGFGLDTYIYNIGHADTMKTLIEGKYAKMFNTVEELLVFLDKEEISQYTTKFWKENALENQCREIDKYL